MLVLEEGADRLETEEDWPHLASEPRESLVKTGDGRVSYAQVTKTPQHHHL